VPAWWVLLCLFGWGFLACLGGALGRGGGAFLLASWWALWCLLGGCFRPCLTAGFYLAWAVRWRFLGWVFLALERGGPFGTCSAGASVLAWLGHSCRQLGGRFGSCLADALALAWRVLSCLFG
jgi:hypothetical protein